MAELFPFPSVVNQTRRSKWVWPSTRSFPKATNGVSFTMVKLLTGTPISKQHSNPLFRRHRPPFSKDMRFIFLFRAPRPVSEMRWATGITTQISDQMGRSRLSEQILRIDAGDLGDDSGSFKLTQARQLIASDDVSFGLDLLKRDLAVLRQHQVWKPVTNAPKIVAHCADNGSGGAREARQLDVIPSEDAVRAPPSRGNALENQIECIPRANGSKLRFDSRGKLIAPKTDERNYGLLNNAEPSRGHYATGRIRTTHPRIAAQRGSATSVFSA